ncbi:MAG: SOS response-associated peptidase [Anaerolineae bacterium]|nr:SOS response-associated peptidase [Anaerolineae bacterium]
MCGRYSVAVDPEQLASRFNAELPPEPLPKRLNAAPTESLPVLLNEGPRRIELVRWGLIPSWADDPSIGSRLINARAETLAEKPSFRSALKSRRCLVLADAFYEWQKTEDGKKTPYRIALKSGEPFAFAGLWEQWRDPSGTPLRTFTIITTEPNDLVAPIHNRMPAVLRPDAEAPWLGENGLGDEWRDLLTPFPADLMIAEEAPRDVLRRMGS